MYNDITIHLLQNYANILLQDWVWNITTITQHLNYNYNMPTLTVNLQ